MMGNKKTRFTGSLEASLCKLRKSKRSTLFKEKGKYLTLRIFSREWKEEIKS